MSQGRRCAVVALVALLLSLCGPFLCTSAVLAPASARTPKTTPPPPTAPLPVPIVVHPDDDVLGRPGLQVADGLSRPPNVPASGWLLADVDSGAVLAADNARAQLYPASTLKLLTALALAPEFPDDNTEYTATPATQTVDGTRVGMVAGSVYRMSDLLHGLLMFSGNDTAVGLSDLVGGDGPASALMMAKAAELGASDTVVVNTSGLDGAGQVSSARDLALFGRAILDDPRLAPMVARPDYPFPDVGTDFSPARKTYPIHNHNKMVGTYPGTLGLKTGYTIAARGAFAGAAERNGRRLECTMLHSEGQESDHCIKLLDWAFGQPAPAAPLTTLDASAQASAPEPVITPAPPAAPLPPLGATQASDRGAAIGGPEGLPTLMLSVLTVTLLGIAGWVGSGVLFRFDRRPE